MLKKMIAAAAFAALLPAVAHAADAPAGKMHCCCCDDKGRKMDCCDEHKKGGHEGHEGHDMGGKDKAPKA